MASTGLTRGPGENLLTKSAGGGTQAGAGLSGGRPDVAEADRLDAMPPGEQDGAVPRPVTASSHDVTALLQAWTAGDAAARDQLMAVVYRELRDRAARQLRRERRNHSLQPTALVHEAYVRLVDQRRMAWQNRGQFFGVACQMMRRILVDRARAHRMNKRSGQWARVTLDDAVMATPPLDLDVLDLDAALTRLAAFDSRKTGSSNTMLAR